MKRIKMQLKPEMLPEVPEFPVVGIPQWLTPSPGLVPFQKKLALTMQVVKFRDRFGWIWTVPPRYPTDGMSYPWLWRLFKDRFAEATIDCAVLHDYTYSMHDYFDGWPIRRSHADRNLLDGLLIKAPREARIDYIGVRLLGGPVYEHKRHDKYMIDWIDFSFGPF